MALGFNDKAAKRLWGEQLFEAIPKSVFAVVAWHLANLCSDEPDQTGAAQARFAEEIQALVANRLLDPDQAKRVLSAFAKSPRS